MIDKDIEHEAKLTLSEVSSFINAARKLDTLAGDWSPKYYLLCHAVEIGLKAFLLLHKHTPSELKTFAVRHSLKTLAEMARCHGMSFTARESEIIELIDAVHADHRLRYVKPGSTQMPQQTELEDFAEDILQHGWDELRLRERRRDAPVTTEGEISFSLTRSESGR